jgi:hypothetical protein
VLLARRRRPAGIEGAKRRLAPTHVHRRCVLAVPSMISQPARSNRERHLESVEELLRLINEALTMLDHLVDVSALAALSYL